MASASRSGGPVAAHSQVVSVRYVVHYPEHEPRASDPHYHAFEAFRAAHSAAAVCFVGERLGFGECRTAQGHPLPVQPLPVAAAGLELHHAHLEFALLNAVSLTALQHDFPDLTDPVKVAAWAESDRNFMWLCAWHHRGAAGAHHATHADWTAGLYVPHLISGA